MPVADSNDTRHSPAAARNREPIAAAVVEHMPHHGTILEVASGTGEHVVHLARVLPQVRWLPGDPDPESRRSISAWIARSGLTNIAAPHATDVTAERWPVEDDAPFDGIVCINMIHIAPLEAAAGLFAGAGRLLGPQGRLFLYGPFSRHGRHTAPSNAAFDASLRARDRRWGVRDLEAEVVPLAAHAGLRPTQVLSMPANNLVVLFAAG